jgi:hypothetical protein
MKPKKQTATLYGQLCQQKRIYGPPFDGANKNQSRLEIYDNGSFCS